MAGVVLSSFPQLFSSLVLLGVLDACNYTCTYVRMLHVRRSLVFAECSTANI